ncbi:MAG: polyketide cyclase [Clostridium sp.]
MKKSTVVARFTSPLETIWNIVTDNTAYAWRRDLAKIKTSDDGKSFIEITKDGFETEFFITIKKPYDLYEFDVKNKNMRGHWRGLFSKDATGTKIEFVEEVEVSNPVMNLFVKAYLKKQQATYIADLKKALGE